MKILVTDGMDKTALEQLKKNGHEVTEQFFPPEELGAALKDFDAVIVPNDRCGAGVLNALLAQGFRVPSQVSLICLDSGLIAKAVSPTLTSMASADYEIGQHCAYQLLHLIDGEPAENVVIAPKLLIENSTQFNDSRG